MKTKKIGVKKINIIYPVIALIILVVIILSVYALKSNLTPEEELGKCIGKRSVLYVQEGCGACHTQLNKLQEIEKYLTIIDCKDNNWQLCFQEGIRATPTWKINSELIVGIKTLEQLKELTGC